MSLMQGLIAHNILSKPILAFKERPRHNSNQIILTIEQSSLTIAENNSIILAIDTYDLIGVIDEQIEENLYRLDINSFPKRGRCFGPDRRSLQTFQCWLKMSQKELKQLKSQLIKIITNRSIEDPSKPFKLIVYLNPNAGSNSQNHFNTIQSFLSKTNFVFDLVRTTHRGHCQEHLSTLDYKQYEGVIVISGDGLMHEFVNSKACGRIAVSHVPGGSGNAFSKVQTLLAEEECRDQEAIFLVVKGRTRNMNLMKVELQHFREPIYSFLSFEWAFLADIDMNSQFLRCLGGLRFQIYSVYRCLALRRYRGRVSYSTASQQLPPLTQQLDNKTFTTIQTQFLNANFCVIPFISDKYEFAPLIKVQDEAIDMQFITSDHGRWQLIKYLLSSSSGDHFDKEAKAPKQGYDFTYSNVKSFRLEPLGEGDLVGLFGIDGERYDAQKMQASMSDKKVLTFA